MRAAVTGGEPSATTTWSPAVDIYETESEIMVKAELPGIERKDIALNLDNNVLTLKGERRFEKETKQENYHRIERVLRRLQPSIFDPGNRG